MRFAGMGEPDFDYEKAIWAALALGAALMLIARLIDPT